MFSFKSTDDFEVISLEAIKQAACKCTGRLFASHPCLPTLQHDFADAVAAFNVAMGLLQIGHVDGADDFVQRGFDFARID